MKKGILVVSFGTSYAETRKKTIDVIETKIAEAFSGVEVRRAFTSNFIIKKLKERDGIDIKTPLEALEVMIKDGFEEIIVQSLHVIPGFEYDKIKRAISVIHHRHRDVKITFGKPLLYLEEHYDEVIEALVEDLPEKEGKSKIVLMGHGTEHPANACYSMLQNKFSDIREDILIANVEGYPELDHIMERVKTDKTIENIVLAPLMIVAGDHTLNDMAGDEESFKSEFEEAGYKVTCIIKGLGEYKGIHQAFINRIDEMN